MCLSRNIWQCILLCWACSFLHVKAQAPNEIPEGVQVYIEAWLADKDNVAEAENLVVRFEELSANPINLNKAGFQEFQNLFFLTGFQIQMLYDYVKEKGPVVSLNELAYVHGFDMPLVEFLSFFIVLDDGAQIQKNAANHFKHGIVLQTIIKPEVQVGFLTENDSIPASFHGDRFHHLFKYAVKSNTLRAGLVFEKDAGEQYIIEKKPSFINGYIHWKPANQKLELLTGNYRLGFGEGLLVWNGFGFSKPVLATSISKPSSVFAGTTSSYEANGLSGLAAKISIKKITLIPFYSYKRAHATVATNDEGALGIQSIYTAGYFRTVNEFNKFNAYNEHFTGVSGQVELNKVHMGALFYHQKLNLPLLPSDEPYKIFDATGANFSGASIYYKLMLNKLLFFGEQAHTLDYGYAFLNGMEFYVNAKARLSLLHRYYQADFYAPFANAISENTNVKNEKALLAGLELVPFNKLTYNAYIDFFKFPWLKYGVSAPSSGFEGHHSIQYILNENLKVFVSQKWESKFKDQFVENIPQTSEFRISRHKIRFEQRYFKTLTLKTGVNYNWYEDQTSIEKSFLIYQDVQYAFLSLPVQFTLRFMHFDAEGYNSRIHVYEPDVYQAFSIPMFTYEGYRYVMLIKWKASRSISCWLRAAQSINPASGFSSGNTYIAGKRSTDLSIQWRIDF